MGSAGKAFKIISITLIAIIFVSWIIPFVRNEILTAKHLHELEFEGIEYYGTLKVIKHNEKKAELYAVTNSRKAAIIITFKKIDGKYEYDHWDAVWSKTGSADDMLWPYFWR